MFCVASGKVHLKLGVEPFRKFASCHHGKSWTAQVQCAHFSFAPFIYLCFLYVSETAQISRGLPPPPLIIAGGYRAPVSYFGVYYHELEMTECSYIWTFCQSSTDQLTIIFFNSCWLANKNRLRKTAPIFRPSKALLGLQVSLDYLLKLNNHCIYSVLNLSPRSHTTQNSAGEWGSIPIQGGSR